MSAALIVGNPELRDSVVLAIFSKRWYSAATSTRSWLAYTEIGNAVLAVRGLIIL